MKKHCNKQQTQNNVLNFKQTNSSHYLLRWLLLCFKREFPYEESLMIFEIISSQHLELSSETAERARDVARARDFLKGGK